MGTNYSVRDFKPICIVKLLYKYVVKHKSAKLFMTYVVGKLEARGSSQYKPFNIKYKQSERIS